MANTDCGRSTKPGSHQGGGEATHRTRKWARKSAERTAEKKASRNYNTSDGSKVNRDSENDIGKVITRTGGRPQTDAET